VSKSVKELSPYQQRDILVAVFARLWPSHLAPAQDSEEGWRYVVCVHSPKGQMAWHVADDELAFFRGLDIKPSDWDGHTSAQKTDRLIKLIASMDHPRHE